MQFEVSYASLQPIIDDFNKAGGNAQPLVSRMLTNSVTEIQKRAREKAPHFTGALQRSIQAEEGFPTAKVKVNSPYGAAMEYGTSPHMPPVDALTRWANSKGIDPWALAFTIKAKGTKKHPYFQPAIDESKPYINEQLRYVGKRLLTIMAKGV